jgi:hypothetical protein
VFAYWSRSVVPEGDNELQLRTPARLNHGARLAVAGQSLSLANYSSLIDYETELLWMFNSEGGQGSCEAFAAVTT